MALISDIHGNLLALEAVLIDIEKEQCDKIVCLGDVAATGPQPSQTLERLRSLKCPMVMGNADEELLNPHPFPESTPDAKRLTDIEFWCAKQLSHTQLEFVKTFQPTVEVSLGADAKLLCFHGSPRSNTETIRSTPPEKKLEKMLSGFKAKIMAGGHTHTQMLRRYKDTTIINPGSVGLPYETLSEGHVRNPPRAEYAILNCNNGILGVELRQVPISVGELRRIVENSGMPHASWWMSDWG